MEFSESFKTIKPFSARTDFVDYVPTQGLSLEFILKHMSDLQGVETMYDLEQYVVEQTRRFNCSFVEMLQEHEVYKEFVTEKATFFVSFAYSSQFHTILSALDKHRRKIGVKDIDVWISIFTINQHFGRGNEQVAPIIYPKSWFKKAFEISIASIKNVLFVLSPLAMPVALQRLWCIYELYLTVLYDECSLDVCLSESDEEAFMKGLLEDTESILEYINGINAEQAKSSNPAQEAKLRNRMETMPGGYEKIDTEVREKLRLWFADTAKGFIDLNKEEYSNDKAKYIRLLRMVGKMLEEAGRYDAAEPLCYEALYESLGFYGSDNEETAISMSNLGFLLFSQGNFAEAEPLYRRALEISQQELGPHDVTIGTRLSNLGTLLQRTGRFAEAVPLLREAIGIFKAAHGSEHRIVATALTNLGHLLQELGHKEAETLYREALTIGRKVFDSDHPLIANWANNLGFLLKTQGRFQEAEPLLKESLAILRKTLGPQHPRVALAINNLSMLLADMGKLQEAVKLKEEGVAIERQVLGENHPQYAGSISNLATLLVELGRLEEAEPLHRQALAITKAKLGATHPEVGYRLNNLGMLLFEQRKLDDAEHCLRSALTAFENSLGYEHPNVAVVLDNIAKVLIAKGKDAEALSLQRRAQAIRNKRG